MIYVATSMILAHLLVEDRSPPESLWRETLVSSRLMEGETSTRLHARGLADARGKYARTLIALERFPSPALSS